MSKRLRVISKYLKKVENKNGQALIGKKRVRCKQTSHISMLCNIMLIIGF
jgi:hypothetical protein